jgi:hypothetical protein
VAIDRSSRPEVAAAIRAASKDFERPMREEEKAFVSFVVQDGAGLERYLTSELLHLPQ